MKRTLLLLATLAAASTFSTACGFDGKSERRLPTAPGAPSAPGPAPAPAPGSGSLVGTWTSESIALPSAGSCSNFQWQVSSAIFNSMAGNFSATCAGNFVIVGTASGRIEGTSVPLAVAGTATVARALSCEFFFSGTGVIENSETITIPYTGELCGIPISGTQTLRRPSSAPAEPPPPAPPAPADPLFGCGGLLKLKLVECIWNHIHPTDHITAFNVTKRVAWALRGEGAGLLIETGGENIAAWQGNLFSASRIVYPDGHLYKVISDAGPGGANGASWQDEGVDPGLRSLYFPAMDPSLP
jgi:hypothetical protein